MTDAEQGTSGKGAGIRELHFETAMEDDFNTADAVAAIFDLGETCKYNGHSAESFQGISARALL